MLTATAMILAAVLGLIVPTALAVAVVLLSDDDSPHETGAQRSRRGSVGHRSDAHAGQLSNGAGGGGDDEPCNSAGVGGVKEARNRS
jgi:hypothetical protein